MTKITRSPEFTREEVRLALRNHGMPLEGLRYPITPIVARKPVSGTGRIDEPRSSSNTASRPTWDRG